MTNTEYYYVAEGPVRGRCPHKHRSFDTAEKCARRDMWECAQTSRGAYSDRRVVAVTVEHEKVG